MLFKFLIHNHCGGLSSTGTFQFTALLPLRWKLLLKKKIIRYKDK